MKQILFVLILLFAFTMQIEVKNKTLETVKFRNIKYDPRKIFKISPIEICGPGKIVKCDSKNSCTCVLRKNLKRLTTNSTKLLNFSKIFSNFYEKKCKPGYVSDCSYKYSKFSPFPRRECICKKEKRRCKEGYSYICRRLPGMFIGKMERPTICQCEKDNNFMSNVERNFTKKN